MGIPKLKILFISKHPVHDGIPMAGNQLFNDTLKSFCKDERFDCGFMTVQKTGADIESMRKQFGTMARDFSVILPKIWTPFTYLFYNTKLGIQLAHIDSKWLYLDPIYRSYFQKAIRKVLASHWKPDIIIFEWTEVLFLDEYCRNFFPNAKMVATEHDVSFIKLERRFVNRPVLMKLVVNPFKKAELASLNEMDLIRVLSIDDRERLVLNGIPIQKITVTAPFFQNKNLPAKPLLENTVIFYGAMNRMENQEAVSWFIDNVFITFKLDRLIRFVIVGGGQHSLKAKYAHIKGIEFLGFVEDPSMLFVKSLCMVVPLLNGGGIKIKILESMTCSLPVLTNDIGMEGIGGKANEAYLHCDNPEQYAKAIQFLLENKKERIDLGEAARKWINDKFNYPKDLNIYKEELLALGNKTVQL